MRRAPGEHPWYVLHVHRPEEIDHMIAACDDDVGAELLKLFANRGLCFRPAEWARKPDLECLITDRFSLKTARRLYPLSSELPDWECEDA